MYGEGRTGKGRTRWQGVVDPLEELHGPPRGGGRHLAGNHSLITCPGLPDSPPPPPHVSARGRSVCLPGIFNFLKPQALSDP